MPNPWTDHVKKYAATHNIPYACALATKECKDSYSKATPKTSKERTKINKEKKEVKRVTVVKQTVKVASEKSDDDIKVEVKALQAKNEALREKAGIIAEKKGSITAEVQSILDEVKSNTSVIVSLNRLLKSKKAGALAPVSAPASAVNLSITPAAPTPELREFFKKPAPKKKNIN